MYTPAPSALVFLLSSIFTPRNAISTSKQSFLLSIYEAGSFKNQNYGRFTYDSIQVVRTLKIIGA